MCNYSDAIYRMGMEAERKASEEREKRIAVNLRTMGNTIENIAKSMEIRILHENCVIK